MVNSAAEFSMEKVNKKKPLILKLTFVQVNSFISFKALLGHTFPVGVFKELVAFVRALAALHQPRVGDLFRPSDRRQE